MWARRAGFRGCRRSTTGLLGWGRAGNDDGDAPRPRAPEVPIGQWASRASFENISTVECEHDARSGGGLDLLVQSTSGTTTTVDTRAAGGRAMQIGVFLGWVVVHQTCCRRRAGAGGDVGGPVPVGRPLKFSRADQILLAKVAWSGGSTCSLRSSSTERRSALRAHEATAALVAFPIARPPHLVHLVDEEEAMTILRRCRRRTNSRRTDRSGRPVPIHRRRRSSVAENQRVWWRADMALSHDRGMKHVAMRSASSRTSTSTGEGESFVAESR